MDLNYQVCFSKQEVEIICIIFEIIQNVVDLKKIFDFNDVFLLLRYIFKNVEFKELFFEIIVILFKFIF